MISVLVGRRADNGAKCAMVVVHEDEDEYDRLTSGLRSIETVEWSRVHVESGQVPWAVLDASLAADDPREGRGGTDHGGTEAGASRSGEGTDDEALAAHGAEAHE